MLDREKLLIVGPSWVGDMVMAQSLFRLLRRDDPGVLIDVLAPAWSQPLLDRMPEVNRAVPMPLGHGELGLAARYRIGRSLRAVAYDRAIVLPRSFKAALVPWFANIPRRVGFRGEYRYGLLTDVRVLDRLLLDQTVKRFLALGQPIDAALPQPPLPELTVDRQNCEALCTRFELHEAGTVVALMPGAAYGPAKSWPVEHFGELARQLTATGIEVWVLGSEKEHPDGEAIRNSGGPRVINLCGRTRLEDTVDLLSMADFAVTNDSGLMHVAAASGAHVVAVYGSSSPDFTPPLTAAKSIHYLGLECSPCFKRECPLGHLRCLKEISPESVTAGILGNL